MNVIKKQKLFDPVLWNHINNIHLLYISNIIMQELFSSIFASVCFQAFCCYFLRPSTLIPGSPDAFYLECRLQRQAGILLFAICERLSTSHSVIGIHSKAALVQENVALLMGQYLRCFLNVSWPRMETRVQHP